MGDKKYYRRLRLWGDIPAPPVAAPANRNRRDENPEIRSRMKNISQILGKGEDINVTRKAPPSAKKAAERKRKKETPRKASTSTGKRRKTSTLKTQGRVEPDITSNNSGEAEVAPQYERKTKEKPKPKLKSNKKKVNENTKLKQGEATPSNKTGEFIGLYVCKEFDGEKTLGTVVSYEAEKKLYKIGYDNLKTEYTKQDEVLKIKATGEDIFEVRQLQQQSVLSKVPITSPED
ncbi:hypothetical protein VNO80_15127 [Phaseolus coccineus]|uniref:Uncharacterized protein n=1 Tax=Phaseolus coccineus TaxID=3886 RepID=A0AAN9R6Q0_PHACN